MKANLVLIFMMISFGILAQTDAELVNQTVDQNMIKGQIHFLCLDALKGRDTGSPGLELAADYIEAQIKQFGIQHAPGMNSYRQPVPFTKTKPASTSILTLNDVELNSPDDYFILDADNVFIESNELVFIGFGLATDYKDVDVKGKIVIANAGDGESSDPQSWYYLSKEKNKLATQAGATAILELYLNPKAPYNFVKRFLASSESMTVGHLDQGETALPHLMIDASKDKTVESLKSGTSGLTINIDGIKKEELFSDNIVGYIEGTDPVLKKEVVVYSAHYDHVGIGKADIEGDTIYNGARDNAVGTTTVLVSSENIAKYPTRRSALFVLFTAEEKGLLGSKWFVDHSPIPLEDIVYCFNSDNGGYNDTSIASIVGLERTSAQTMIEQACTTYGLTAIEDPAKEQGLFDRSDNVNFAAKGIPAPTFSMGFTSFDAEIQRYYHQPGDHAQNLDYDYLFKFFKAYTLSARLIGNADEAPFWVDGDKYTKLGKALYNRE